MPRRSSWFRSPSLRRKQRSAHRGESSLAGNSKLHNRRLLLEKLEDRTLLALVSYWTGDNTAADAMGTNNGSLVSGTTYAPGQIGQAFSFDGIDDRVGVADSASLKLTGSMSIEGWVKATGLPTEHGMIFFRGDDRGGLDPYWLDVEPNGQVQFTVESLTAAAGVSTQMPMGQFVHVAATLDDATGEIDLYLNGILMSHTVTAVRPFGDLDPASNPGIGIGNHGGYPQTPHNFPFKGLIDSLKVYNNALTSQQVRDDFNAGNGSLLPAISISDATATEGNQKIQYLGNLISARDGGLDDPYAIQYGPDGNLYVSSKANSNILRYDAISGAPLPAPGKSGAEFVSPGAGGLSSAREFSFGPDGNLYVVSELNSEILRFDAATGEPLGELVSSGSGGLAQPRGLLFHTDGYLYVTSVGGASPGAGTNSILRFNAITGAPAGLSGLPGDAVFIPSGAGGLDAPTQIVFHNGDFYVSSNSNSVLRFGADGTAKGAFVASGSGGLAGPVDLEFRDNYLYVTSWSNNKVLRYNATSGAFVDEMVSGGGLVRPRGLLFEPGGSFLIASGDSDEIRRYGVSTDAVFTISLSAPFPTSVSVSYATANGSATAGSDYLAASGTVTFEPGQFQKTVLVPIVNNTLIESTESFFVNLSNPAGAVLSDSQGIGTIIDDDSPSTATKFYVVDSTADKTFEYGATGQALAGNNWALASTNTNARGATSNATGSRLWVVDSAGKVYLYDNDGHSLGAWTAGGVRQAEGITTDGVNIWIVDARDHRALYYAGATQVTTGTIQPTSTFPLSAVNDNPTGITTDGKFIWINDDDKSNGDNIWRYTMTGQFQGGWDLPSPNTKAAGITIDPTHASDSIWVVDSGTDKVYEYKGIYQTTFTNLTLVKTFSLASGNGNATDIADPPVSIADPPVSGVQVSDVVTAAPSVAGVLAIAGTGQTPVSSSKVKLQTTSPLPSAAAAGGPDSVVEGRGLKAVVSGEGIHTRVVTGEDEAICSIADELDGLLPVRKLTRR